MSRKIVSIKYLSFVLCCLPQSVTGATIENESSSTPVEEIGERLNIKPQPSLSTKLDYEYLDYILDNIVFYLGPSDRIRRVRRNTSGGRRVGHSSPYRMEGSRVYLTNLPVGFSDDISVYRKELESLVTSLPITHLSNDEQLAFWFNLHNVSLLELMSSARRARYTNDERYGLNKTALHDAKFIKINGVQLSLRDIREKIVFEYWYDPKVIYGFFLGDVGGPSLQNEAFTGDNVHAILETNAKEFVNSLRGFEIHRGRAQVSQIYHDTHLFYFQNFEHDLEKHFSEHMRPDVYSQFERAEELRISKYEYRIASVEAGRSAVRIRGETVYGISSVDRRSALGFLIRGYLEKREKLQGLGLLESEVIIEDIETIDPDEVK